MGSLSNKKEYAIVATLLWKTGGRVDLSRNSVTNLSIDSTADVTLNTLTLKRHLSVAVFYSAKPRVSLRVTTTGGTATTINGSDQKAMGNTGATSLASFGQVQCKRSAWDCLSHKHCHLYV